MSQEKYCRLRHAIYSHYAVISFAFSTVMNDIHIVDKSALQLSVVSRSKVMFANYFGSYKEYLEADYHLWFFPPALTDMLPTCLIPDEI